MYRQQSGSTDAVLMNGNGPSPGASSVGSVSGRLFPDESERRHMEIASDMARLQDVSARQNWPAVSVGKPALGTCSRWGGGGGGGVAQHAGAFVQELQLLDRRMEDASQSGRWQQKLSAMEHQLQDALEAMAVRGSRLTVHPATCSPHQICAAQERLPLRQTGCKTDGAHDQCGAR